MVRDAESHAADDKEQRDRVDLKNKADQMVYQVEKTLTEAPEQVTDDDKKPVVEAVTELKGAIGNDDVDAMSAGLERLEKASHRLAEVIYRSQAPGQPEDHAHAGAGAHASTGGDDIIDAEVVDSDESKN